MENPSALVNPSLHGYDHSGSRPPDKLAQIGEPPVLETDGVAVETLDPCTPKKLKNSDDVVDGNLKSSAILENGLSTDSAMRRLASGSDVRRDESAQAKADRTTKLYGSWMLVTNNRRRNLSSKAGSKGARTGGAVNEGSRFAILNDDVMEEGLPVGQTEGVVAMDMGGDEGQHVKKDVVSSSKGMLSTHNIVKNAAYLTSNLNKRAKNGGSVANRVMEVDIPCGWDSTRTCVTKGDEWRWESYSGFYWG
ncbi:hypothetical protein V6N13_050096 [Hibiscus sabdariffa]